jgi:hydroxymethylglutaryl-CoA reductase
MSLTLVPVLAFALGFALTTGYAVAALEAGIGQYSSVIFGQEWSTLEFWLNAVQSRRKKGA